MKVVQTPLMAFHYASLATAIILVTALGGVSVARGQQLVVDFRFDDNSFGPNPTSAGATSVALIPGSSGQTYTIDIWMTVVPSSSRAYSSLGMDIGGVQGVSDTLASGSAFATGSGIGVVANSFNYISPFTGAHLFQPTVADLGSSSNNGASVNSTVPDGILDFGGDGLKTNYFAADAIPPGFVLGGGSSGQINPNGGWEWKVGTFQFTTGTASSVPGTTALFIPTQTPTQLPSASFLTQDGATNITSDGTTVSRPITVGSSLTFVVAGGTPAPATVGLTVNNQSRFMQNQTYVGGVSGVITNPAPGGANALNTAPGANLTATVTGSASLSNLTTGKGSLAPGAFTTFDADLTTGTSTGIQTVTVTEADPAASNGSVTGTQSINVLAPRSFSLGNANFGDRVLVGQPLDVFLGIFITTSGDDASTSRAYLTSAGTPDANGVYFLPGTSSLYNGASSNTIWQFGGRLPLHTFGTITGTLSLEEVTGEAPYTHDISGSSFSSSYVATNVGQAIADNSGGGMFSSGTACSAVLKRGEGYAGLESKVVALNGIGGVDAKDANGLGGNAIILSGVSNNGKSGGFSILVSMGWRTRTSAETGSTSRLRLVSDVMNLTMTSNGAQFSGDPFVVDMSYNPALLVATGNSEDTLVAAKWLHLSSITSKTSAWENTVFENKGNIVVSPADSQFGFQGSFAAFVAAHNGIFGQGADPSAVNFGLVTDAQLNQIMGAWGVDATTHEAWAVVDHTGQFAVVPEPFAGLLVSSALDALLICWIVRKGHVNRPSRATSRE